MREESQREAFGRVKTKRAETMWLDKTGKDERGREQRCSRRRVCTFKWTVAVLLGVGVLTSLVGAPEQNEAAKTWFPLEVGYRWVYQVTDGQGNTFTNERRVVQIPEAEISSGSYRIAVEALDERGCQRRWQRLVINGRGQVEYNRTETLH